MALFSLVHLAPSSDLANVQAEGRSPFSSVRATVALGDDIHIVLKGIRGPSSSNGGGLEVVLYPEDIEVVGPGNRPIRFGVNRERNSTSIEFTDRGVWTSIDLGDCRVINGVSGLRIREIGVDRVTKIVPTHISHHGFNFTNDPSPPPSIRRKLIELNRFLPKQGVKKAEQSQQRGKYDWEAGEVRARLGGVVNGKGFLRALDPLSVEFQTERNQRVMLAGRILISRRGDRDSFIHSVHWDEATLNGTTVPLRHPHRGWWSFRKSDLDFQVGTQVRVVTSGDHGFLVTRKPRTSPLQLISSGKTKRVVVGAGILLLATGIAAYKQYGRNWSDHIDLKAFAANAALSAVAPTMGLASSALTEAISGENFSTIFRNVMNPAHLLSTGLSLTPAGGLLSILAPFLG